MVTDTASGTSIDEVASGIYRISVPVSFPARPGGFSFNQYLLVDDEPLLFHTGPRQFFELVRGAVQAVLPLDRLRWVGFSHHENDEDGSADLWMDAVPSAQPVCGRIQARLNGPVFGRAPRALGDGEALQLGQRSVQWIDTPHLPHGWECGYFFESTTRTLLCGDLFTQPGANTPPLTRGDILGPSEALRAGGEYFARSPETPALFAKLARLQPKVLACMHGSAFEGDGAALLNELARRVVP